ncbi:hypothetical protein F9230_14655 [Acinetobacter johnsonii]|uniref:hypothetical protein n=1 Tax=Acinetobacter johnsonii TaxID=40214 RepID=UPI001F1B791B|nr:hypothetical protein [Acinetobacter johnsonii]UJA05516.1 hypothetical protein F9230_14655 [Acinetobacter johnsonii]
MPTKKDLSIINAAYYCSTGAQLAPPHPSPVNIYQASSLFEKVTAKSLEKAIKGSNMPIIQAIHTIPWLSNAPWFNGNMTNISLDPYIANFCDLAVKHGLTQQLQNSVINPSAILSFSQNLQYCIQTSEFTHRFIDWSMYFEISKNGLNTVLRNIEKNSSGFELQEFCTNYDAAQHGTLQMRNLNDLINRDMKSLLNQFESDRCLAIFLKNEPSLNQRMNLRYIVVLQKDYIDEPAGFTDLSFFQNLKNKVESNSCYTITHESGCLNNFLANNRFSKKSPNYRERINCLKNYLIGTDFLYRTHGESTSFSVLYSKFE